MRPIAISLSPNAQGKDVRLALSKIFFPWNYFRGNHVKLLEQWFRQYFNASFAVSFVSGRGAFLAILKALDIKEKDEVIIQSFTCVVVPSVIIGIGARPIYIDIDNSLTMDVTDLERKITDKTKAIVIQHTFGIPSNMEIISKIAKKYKIPLIEDCAHTIGATYKNKKLGSLGLASFFSFGREKAFSCIFGGIALTDEDLLGKKIRMFQKKQRNPSFFWVFQQLFHPIAFYFILPVYNFLYLGKVMLVLLQKIHLLSFPVESKEKQGKISSDSIKKLPSVLACLALFQLKRLNEFNKKREEISKIYIKEITNKNIDFPSKKNIPFLRFPLLINNRDEVLDKFKKKGIYLGQWYSNIIDPKDTELRKVYYQRGSCPNAELIAKRIINLPTYINLKGKDIKKIVKLLSKYA